MLGVGIWRRMSIESYWYRGNVSLPLSGRGVHVRKYYRTILPSKGGSGLSLDTLTKRKSLHIHRTLWVQYFRQVEAGGHEHSAGVWHNSIEWSIINTFCQEACRRRHEQRTCTRGPWTTDRQSASVERACLRFKTKLKSLGLCQAK